MEQKLISIVLPIFNEEHNIPLIYQELQNTRSSLYKYVFEVIFINDGSRDRSWQVIEQLAMQDKHVKAINLSRNFGHQAALSAGYCASNGDAIITMDADLQDPPELLPSMLSNWEQGSKIVYARRADRKDNMLKRITAVWYYKLLEPVFMLLPKSFQ